MEDAVPRRPLTSRSQSRKECRSKKALANPNSARPPRPPKLEDSSYSDEEFVRDFKAAFEDPDADYSWNDELPEDPGVPSQPGDAVVEFHPRRASGTRRQLSASPQISNHLKERICRRDHDPVDEAAQRRWRRLTLLNILVL